MVVYIAKIMWDDKSEVISINDNLAYAMRNVLAWLSPDTCIYKITQMFDDNVWVYTEHQVIVIQRFRLNAHFKFNDIIEKY